MIELTGMRFAAVASVTEQSWTACAVRDDLGFGLLPGQQLELESTICNEIRQHQRPVVFGHASADPHYRQHHTPKQYGLESYLSVPMVLFSAPCARSTVDLPNSTILPCSRQSSCLPNSSAASWRSSRIWKPAG